DDVYSFASPLGIACKMRSILGIIDLSPLAVGEYHHIPGAPPEILEDFLAIRQQQDFPYPVPVDKLADRRVISPVQVGKFFNFLYLVASADVNSQQRLRIFHVFIIKLLYFLLNIRFEPDILVKKTPV